jgi:drug/metabolite transporter (DMT)-like permease
MFLTGILLGLGAALFQSFSYLFSRSYVKKYHSPFELLIIGHIIMGAASLVILPFLPTSKLPEFKLFAWPLIACALTYVFAQFSFFMTIRYAAPSRVSPLLGLKIIFIAVFGVLFFNNHLSPIQWIATAMCLCGAILSNWTGGTLPRQGILWLFSACAGYSLSDLFIKKLINAMNPDDGNMIVYAIIATVYSYILCGLMALPFKLTMNKKKLKGKYLAALPFSVAWFGAMILIYICFGLIGPVFGNIIQSSRGIISIVLGIVIAHLGHVHLEAKVSWPVFIRRIIAALLIIGAIVMFCYG